MNAKILVAADGRPAANGALRVARLLEQRLNIRVEVVTVWAPIPISGIGTGEIIASAYLDWERMGAAAQLQQVLSRLSELGLSAAGWPVAMEIGVTAPTLVRAAEERASPLIVMGLGRHELVDRWMGTETALQVMRLAHVPVLAVPEETHRLPRRAVVAVDFSEFSRDAGRAVMDLLEPGGEAHLVHVLWKPASGTHWVGGTNWLEEQREHAARNLEALAQLLKQNAAGPVHTHLRAGDPARQVLALAAEVGAELIAAGTHGSGFLGRVLMGSVSTQLVRGATCGVLVSPPHSLPAEVRKDGRSLREILDGSPPEGSPAR